MDPTAPVPIRMMGAKSLVPLSPSDMLGALFMRYRRDQHGLEMIPNREFWALLPGLIKDGFLFCISKVRGTDYVPLK